MNASHNTPRDMRLPGSTVVRNPRIQKALFLDKDDGPQDATHGVPAFPSMETNVHFRGVKNPRHKILHRYHRKEAIGLLPNA